MSEKPLRDKASILADVRSTIASQRRAQKQAEAFGSDKRDPAVIQAQARARAMVEAMRIEEFLDNLPQRQYAPTKPKPVKGTREWKPASQLLLTLL